MVVTEPKMLPFRNILFIYPVFSRFGDSFVIKNYSYDSSVCSRCLNLSTSQVIVSYCPSLPDEFGTALQHIRGIVGKQPGIHPLCGVYFYLMAYLRYTGKISLCVIVVAIVVNVYTPPLRPLSSSLTEWKHSGNSLMINSFSVFYKEIEGDGSGVLICLHGFPSSSYDWKNVSASLKQYFKTIVLLDFLGFGFSDKPLFHGYTIVEQADIVEYLLNKLKITTVDIISHDYGDTVAQELIHRYEQRISNKENCPIISSLCLSNGGIFPETNQPRLIQWILTVPVARHIIPLFSNYYTFKKQFGDVFGRTTQPSQEMFQDYWSLHVYNRGNVITGSIMEFCIERRIPENKVKWVGSLQKTKVPVHMIYGPADPVNPPAFIDHYKKTLPNPSIDVLDQSIAHYPQLEDQKAFVKSYVKFLLNTRAK